MLKHTAILKFKSVFIGLSLKQIFPWANALFWPMVMRPFAVWSMEKGYGANISSFLFILVLASCLSTWGGHLLIKQVSEWQHQKSIPPLFLKAIDKFWILLAFFSGAFLLGELFCFFLGLSQKNNPVCLLILFIGRFFYFASWLYPLFLMGQY